jgi:glycogen debranching enzyme
VPDVARETLQVLADWQATELDPERDMEPGKILHELRFGEMARTGEVPYRPYFGTVDATPLWLVLLDETYRWTGDLELVRSLWPNALAALDWIDRFGDRDRDGFVEYERATDGGAPNHGWKDSEDPIRHADGSIAPTPIALAEVQGYVYDAKVRCAALASLLGDEALATRLRAEADELRWRFDAAFWVPALGCYALALDGQKRQVATVASNMGHCLWSGIVRPARVDAVVDRLLESSMDSGWGIRTYAAGQPGFDPLSYHRGSVWPHDNAVIAAGMRRVGRDDGAARIAAEMLEAAQRSPAFRLPELFSGVARAESGASPAAAAAAAAPEPYPVACSPQAWSAATPLSLLQTLLGLEADTAAGILEVTRPSLPAGVAGVAIERLRVRAGVVDIRLRRADRNGDGAIVEVVRQVGPLEVVGRG